MSSEFDNCIEKRGLKKENPNKDMINKELKEAENDFNEATDSFEDKSFKWCIIQSYYAMFHAAKALVMSKGYREKSHYCLEIALNELFIKTGRIDEKFLDMFDETMGARKDADYGLIYSPDTAQEALDNSGEFIALAKKMLKSDTGD
jgi:uncharacterized protein (UPF0332 family)